MAKQKIVSVDEQHIPDLLAPEAQQGATVSETTADIPPEHMAMNGQVTPKTSYTFSLYTGNPSCEVAPAPIRSYSGVALHVGAIKAARARAHQAAERAAELLAMNGQVPGVSHVYYRVFAKNTAVDSSGGKVVLETVAAGGAVELV
jgi:hypothetical protein